MNVLLWVLQTLLALHTLIGALWKFSNSEQAVPALTAIPHGAWLAMSIFEMLCALCLILPFFSKRLGVLIPIGAIGITAEMLVMSGLLVSSGDTNYGPMAYWLVVAGISAFIAYGRMARIPIR